MRSTYQPFLDRMIHKYEGGYGWDRGDPGGPTKYGITCYDYAEFHHATMNSMSAWAPKVKAMTLDEAELIYRTKYATAVAYDALPAGVDVCLLDYGINSGIGRVVAVLRGLLKLRGPSTHLTPEDTAVIAKLDANRLITQICDERLGFMHRIKGGASWRRFGKGWGARVADLRLYATNLVGKTEKAPFRRDSLPAQKPMAKAQHPEPSVTGPVTTTTGTVATGAGTAATQWHMEPWMWFTFIAGAVALGVAYYLYQRYLAAKANAVITTVGAAAQTVAKEVSGATGPTGP